MSVKILTSSDGYRIVIVRFSEHYALGTFSQASRELTLEYAL